MNLLFDLDGTLADPIDAFSGSLDHACDALTIPRVPKDVMKSLIGPPLLPALGKVLGENAHLAKDVMRLYREHHGKTGIYLYRFYEGMDEAILRLSEDHRIFVATSKPKVYAD